MLQISQFPVFIDGALAGICALVVVLGLIVGHAYSERMLWWHSAAVATALAAYACGPGNALLLSVLWVVQLALAAQTLCAAGGGWGAMRKPAKALQYFTVVCAVVLLALLGSGLMPGKHPLLASLPWALLTAWYISRAWSQTLPWIRWVAAGQAALIVQYLMLEVGPAFTYRSTAELASLAALAIYASSCYVGMVWASRLGAENLLRLEARERTDPLTGLSTQRVFFDRADGALIRSRHLGYTCSLLLIRVENIAKIVEERHLDGTESVILAASRAIASTLRSPDSAARLGNNRFAVIAEAIVEGSSGRMATQILAHGLRAEEWGLKGSELHFQISLIEIDPSDAKASDILIRLEHALHEMSVQHGPHHIVPLPRIERPQPSSRSSVPV